MTGNVITETRKIGPKTKERKKKAVNGDVALVGH
jgi:hypothetical protein